MRLTGEIMKIITCFKLVPEEQDIVVTPEYTLNFDNADAKIRHKTFFIMLSICYFPALRRSEISQNHKNTKI